MDLRPVRALVRAITASAAAALVVIGGGSPLAAPPMALAASVTYRVNTTADTADADVGSSPCRDAHGKCSLRAAVMQANFHVGADTIVIPKGTFKLTRKGRDDVAVLGDLDITDSVTIRGAGATATIVDGNGSVTGDRVFEVLASAPKVTITGLAIRGGKRVGSFDMGGGLLWSAAPSGSLTLTSINVTGNTGYYGGGLYLDADANGASLTVSHVLVSGNKAPTAAAGGIAINIGPTTLSVSLTNSRISGNTAYEGGGLYLQSSASAFATMTVAGLQIDGNKASVSAGIESHAGTSSAALHLTNLYVHGNAASLGGGITNYGYMELRGSTVSGNTASTNGAGVFGEDSSTTYLVNDTISGNVAAGQGGGVFSDTFIHGSALAVIDTTIAGNTAPSGAGIYRTSAATASLLNVLLANAAGGGNCNTTLTASTTSFEDDATCGLGGGSDNATLPLSSLGLHGGSLPTRVPLAGNVGIDAGTTLGDPAVDQRGIARPQGAGTDAGAVEVCQAKPSAPALSKPSNGASTKLRRITLTWKAVTCVEGYKVVVRRKSATGTIVQTVALTQSTRVLTVTLARGYTYYWRVTAIGDRGAANSVWRHVHVS